LLPLIASPKIGAPRIADKPVYDRLPANDFRRLLTRQRYFAVYASICCVLLPRRLSARLPRDIRRCCRRLLILPAIVTSSHTMLYRAHLPSR